MILNHGTTARVELRVQGLGLRRGNQWLFRDMTWSAPAGTLLAVKGPSGAGKSSLLAVLANTLASDEGHVYCPDASPGTHHRPENCRCRVGIVFQDFRLVPNGSVLHNVLCGRLGWYPWWRTLAGFPRQDRAEALDLVQRLGLRSFADRPAGGVSGGEQQRTAVARAVFQRPDILLADEPVSNLDGPSAESVMDLLAQTARDLNCVVVCALHQEDLIRRYADAILTLGSSRWQFQD
jgi:phosphonate transport system ATP-binding protein